MISLSSMLAGCQILSTTEYATNNRDQYLQSRNGPGLVIPKPLSDSNISEFYRLPDQTQPARIGITPPVVDAHKSNES
ncbi:MAG: hypothetical protein CK424_06750 [Legionella sp.]|nr:MAG: hypothetical protein CK424_06750 [Legionella sp.]